LRFSSIFSNFSIIRKQVLANFQLFPYYSMWGWVGLAGYVVGCAGFTMGGWVVGLVENKANSAQLELEMGLSLAKRYARLLSQPNLTST
jgi:predicted Abi (CAAX) family protease